MAKTLNLTLKVWRQENRETKGRIETYAAKDIPVDASFLEMLDIVNEGLVKEGKAVSYTHLDVYKRQDLESVVNIIN